MVTHAVFMYVDVLVSFCLTLGLAGDRRALFWKAVQPRKGLLE